MSPPNLVGRTNGEFTRGEEYFYRMPYLLTDFEYSFNFDSHYHIRLLLITSRLLRTISYGTSISINPFKGKATYMSLRFYGITTCRAHDICYYSHW